MLARLLKSCKSVATYPSPLLWVWWHCSWLRALITICFRIVAIGVWMWEFSWALVGIRRLRVNHVVELRVCALYGLQVP